MERYYVVYITKNDTIGTKTILVMAGENPIKSIKKVLIEGPGDLKDNDEKFITKIERV